MQVSKDGTKKLAYRLSDGQVIIIIIVTIITNTYHNIHPSSSIPIIISIKRLDRSDLICFHVAVLARGAQLYHARSPEGSVLAHQQHHIVCCPCLREWTPARSAAP